jgi:hypothetical protein
MDPFFFGECTPKMQNQQIKSQGAFSLPAAALGITLLCFQ